MERSYIAFISYKHAPRDSAIAKQVHTLIENYVIPKSLRKDGRKKLGIVFRDEEELPISSDLTDSICTALDATQYLIVICSRAAKESPWVAREVQYFLKNHDARNAFVVLADGEPNEVFPYELTHVLNKETGECQEVEPLAMDVRADNIGTSLKKAKTYIKKLYAGMLGCSYDSLVQREKARRLKRLVALVTLCVVLAGCFIGMLFVKNRELSQKNNELTAAIELALNRESELLVEKADEALQSGDVAAAIKYANDALYSEEVERPYYAPAERALFYAADVLREEEDAPLMSKIALKHHTPVESMVYSADGATIFTIDSYGTVSSFDCSGGDLLWNVKLADHGDTAIIGVAPQIWYDEASGVVACYYDEFLSGLDAMTGRLLWQNEFEHTVTAGIFYDAAEQRLAYIEKEYTHNFDDIMQSYNDYNFVVYSIKDGSLLNRINFEGFRKNSWSMNDPRFGNYNYGLSTGMFTGSNRFIGTVFKEDGDTTQAMLYTVDLSENTVSYIENESYNDDLRYLWTFDFGNDRALVVNERFGTDPETGYSTHDLWLQCFDLKAGGILWENSAEAEGSIFTGCNCLLIPRLTTAVLGVGENLYVVDNETGEIRSSMKLNAEIIDLYPMADGLLFGYMLADGYCAVGWSNADGMYDSSYFLTSVDLPDTSEAVHYNNGLIQAYLTENSIDSFNIQPLQDGGGSVTYLSDDKCTAYVTSILPPLVLPEPVIVGESHSSITTLGDFIDVNPQGKTILGVAHLEDGYALNVVDTENHTIETIGLDEFLNVSDRALYLTNDGQNVIDCMPYGGDIRSIGMDGHVSVLSEGETVTLKVIKDTTYVAERFRADAARQTADGRVLIAKTDGQDITYWMDGKEETSVSGPGDICAPVVDGVSLRFMFRVGENGLMVLGDFISEEETVIDNFAIYDLSGKKWKQIPDAVHGSDERLLVFGQDSPVFAVYDADMCIRIYDYDSASLVHSISTELPMVSVEKIGMLLDDRYVYVLTRDGQFIIYCVETNEQVFRTIFSGFTQAKSFSNWIDRENDRLYLRADAKGLCIDVRAWEQLFSAKDFKFYSAVQNEVYIYCYDSGGYTLKAYPIPTTSKLIDMALETLN